MKTWLIATAIGAALIVSFAIILASGGNRASGRNDDAETGVSAIATVDESSSNATRRAAGIGMPPRDEASSARVRIAERVQKDSETDAEFENRVEAADALERMADGVDLTGDERERLWRIISDAQVNYARVMGECMDQAGKPDPGDFRACMKPGHESEVEEVMRLIKRDIPKALPMFNDATIGFLITGARVGIFEESARL